MGGRFLSDSPHLVGSSSSRNSSAGAKVSLLTIEIAKRKGQRQENKRLGSLAIIPMQMGAQGNSGTTEYGGVNLPATHINMNLTRRKAKKEKHEYIWASFNLTYLLFEVHTDGNVRELEYFLPFLALAFVAVTTTLKRERE